MGESVMKAILSKATIILSFYTAIFLGIYLFVVTRPISYDLAYHNETVYEGVHYEGKIKLRRDGTMEVINAAFVEPAEFYWYYKGGYMFSLMAETEEEYEAEVAYINENFEAALEAPFYASKTNSFTMVSPNDDYVLIYACKSIFVFAVCGGIILIAMIALTCSSWVYFIKERRAASRKRSLEGEKT
jgi:hypothetical protein